MKALLVGNAKFGKGDLISPAQLYPFFDHRQQLQQELGLTFHHVHGETFAEIEQICESADVDAFFIRPAWQEDPAAAERCLSQLRNSHPASKIIFIDPFDQVSSKFFNVLPYVDRFVKYQRLKDVSLYPQLVGGTMITDFLAKHMGYELNGWSVTSEIPAGTEHRIVTGWNVTLIDRFKKALFARPRFWRPQPKKDIDIFCRLSLGHKDQLEWYGQYRIDALKALEPLASRYKLAANGEFIGEKTISSRQYFNEIRRSRIAFCPFGWAETTWRDYEAICYGCLLVKPEMDHLATQPNIYIPNETYVPVRWDFQDLEEKCQYYLEHPEEANRIIANARQVYMDYFKRGEFVKTIQEFLQLEAVPSSDLSLNSLLPNVPAPSAASL
ncbi:MAG: glycosyltransferase family 1 protein [Synechococcales cyanobacterium C42_A2020_086]|jgi:glycosyltransferase involved in cell wall biosynthesis|nr:glycosyltransferase family 1 protein [Synechococcales cyanobacterium C42_A2020_086]